jgi:hypothetical protein
MNIPITILLTKPKTSELMTLIGTNLDDCLQKITLYLKTNLEMNIDYPYDFDEFAVIYLDNCANKVDVFDYKIFYENNWIQPWSHQDIYENIVELIIKLDIQNMIIKQSEEEEDD